MKKVPRKVSLVEVESIENESLRKRTNSFMATMYEIDSAVAEKQDAYRKAIDAPKKPIDYKAYTVRSLRKDIE